MPRFEKLSRNFVLNFSMNPNYRGALAVKLPAKRPNIFVQHRIYETQRLIP